ncbi:heavy metal translocating P-type ATPase [Novosphingobium sp. TH158]|uniref:heavy metal translocating P-type ATPase n=1 Tax=Novosphingobium sp. TH158 TaxID=2067455 RepID=UPI000C7A5E8B|nr:heavy metal translocating P-type ATPase [Novosphingobium sp. TH158]PLK24359.1 nitrogen fixation protein FixI [Novosphingobium sp. TH158]
MNAPARDLAPDTLTETVLVVPGMHCAGCMAKVEGSLGAIEGVASARVNLTARQVRVSHDQTVDTPRLVSALAATGFASQPREEDMAPPPSAARALFAPLAVAAFGAMNVMQLSVGVWYGAEGATRDMFHLISALIGVPAIAYSGLPFFRSAWGAVKHWRTNMDVPITIGVTLATALSLYETFTSGHHAWFDGVLMLLFFLLAGRTLDAMMRDRARAGVDALLRQAAPGAMVVGRSGTVEWLPSRDLVPGMVMRVAAGERLAADGVISAGSSRFDKSLLTGESAPIPASEGAEVLAGTLNLDAPVDVKVSRAGKGTALAEIARLMEAAGQSRSAYVRIADRASKLYAPSVHTLALVSGLAWLALGAGWHQSLVIAISVLIITCPCAIGLAVPVAQVVASGALMKKGVMVKDASALERMSQVTRALLDKTGTLTLGRPVPDERALAALSPQAAGIALALASNSAHPLSRALAEALAKAGVVASPIEGASEKPGFGVSATVNGKAVSLRRPDASTSMATALDIEGEPVRLITFADALRPDAVEALARLKAMGIESSILSGDNAAAVSTVAREVGLTAECAATPASKQQAIERLQASGHKVLMAGDGLNDGPALAAAHASIAPGSASDVGRQASDMVFLGDSLLALPRAIAAARRTMSVVRQNFVLAIGYNVLAVPLAMGGYLTPLMAAVAMSTSSVIVVANSLRLVRAAR